jgi:diacylglycerol kinase (ATP)
MIDDEQSPLTTAARNGKPFRLRNRIQSFVFAAHGVREMLRTQHNAWIHAVLTTIVALAGLTMRLMVTEWCWIILAIMAVWTAEALNTAFEYLADVASPEFHPLVEKAKDVAAGAVLIAAIGSTLIGAIIFWPHVIRLVG